LTGYRHWLASGAAALTLGCLAAAPPSAAAESGAQMYQQNCAGCHGADGRGNGPTVNVIPGIKPPDLTLLSKRNGGQFPFQRVEDTIDGRKGVPSHKRFDMPFWGVNLQQSGKEFTPESEARVKARIDTVVDYIKTLQRE
jgi:mono/diheme cytochrome c family protein